MTTQAAIHQAVEERRDEMLAFFKDFLAIETENPPGRNYPEGAQFLSEFMDDRGYDVTIVDVPNDVVETYYPDRTSYPRVNVIGDKGNGHGPNIHFTGHFDVVPAGKNWTRDPYNPIIEDGKVYGRGASDMKSGIVASLFAIDALEDVINLNGTITQSMTVDEETGGFTGLGYLVKEGYLSPDNVDYCIYTECFDSSRICLGHRGVLKFRVTAYGEKAHGCMAHDGQNAIMAMHEFLSQIDTYQDELYTRTTDLPVTPDESNRADINVTMTDAGYSENIIPDQCEATFYRVLVPHESIDVARSEIHELMETTENITGSSFEYEEIMYAEPASVPETCTIAQTYTDHILDFYETTDPVVSPGSDDQRFVVNDAGIDECIVYGPGLLEQAHVADEYVPVEELMTATKVMATATADLMGEL
ncbi:MAG: ArgE/DapE family deacylase [Halobacteriaceae archaeon]